MKYTPAQNCQIKLEKSLPKDNCPDPTRLNEMKSDIKSKDYMNVGVSTILWVSW